MVMLYRFLLDSKGILPIRLRRGVLWDSSTLGSGVGGECVGLRLLRSGDLMLSLLLGLRLRRGLVLGAGTIQPKFT
jgi:hypothetical protein